MVVDWRVTGGCLKGAADQTLQIGNALNVDKTGCSDQEISTLVFSLFLLSLFFIFIMMLVLIVIIYHDYSFDDP